MGMYGIDIVHFGIERQSLCYPFGMILARRASSYVVYIIKYY